MYFEWDPEKERINKAKYQIAFRIAILVFADKNRVERYDLSHSEEEDRFITFGFVYLVMDVVTVVYTMRDPYIRIISARRANRLEKEEYYDCCERF